MLLKIIPILLLILSSALAQPLPIPGIKDEIKYDVINTYPLKTGGENTNILVKEEVEQIDLSSENEILKASVEKYLEKRKDEIRKNKISIIRFVIDQHSEFGKEKRTIIKNLAAKYKIKVRFEKVTIDYDSRKEILTDAGLKKIDDELELNEIEEKKVENKLKSFWNDIYEKPTPKEVAGGAFKGTTTLVLTMSAWANMGLSVKSPIFYILSANHFAQEIFFGPYIKTYINFLMKKIRPIKGDLGVTLYGNLQGFTLFSLDKYLLHLYDPVNISGPWDPVFLSSYFGLSFFGSMFGGFLPSGIHKLTVKGWTTSSNGSIIMQLMDLIMPIEGALLAFDSPLLFPIFIVHQMAKFGVYLLASALPARGMISLIPEQLREDSIINDKYAFDALPEHDFIDNQIKVGKFLNNDTIALKSKLDFIKYVRYITTTQELGGSYRTQFKNIIQQYIKYLEKSEYSNRLTIEIRKVGIERDKGYKKEIKQIEKRIRILRSMMIELKDIPDEMFSSIGQKNHIIKETNKWPSFVKKISNLKSKIINIKNKIKTKSKFFCHSIFNSF